MKSLTIVRADRSDWAENLEKYLQHWKYNTSPVLCMYAAINYFYNQNNHYVHLYNVCGNVNNKCSATTGPRCCDQHSEGQLEDISKQGTRDNSCDRY